MAYIEMTMRSTILDMDTKVDVILPENRRTTINDSNHRYPVLYLLHGMKDDNSTWSRLSTIQLLVRDLDLIVIMPTTYRGFYVNNRYGLDYYRYISEELPIKMANYFPLSLKREETFIMGDSMGGYGALRIGMSQPEHFRMIISLSGGPLPPFDNPACFEQPLIKGVFGSYEEFQESSDNLYRLAKQLNERECQPQLIFYCGTEDPGYQHNRQYVDYLHKECPKLDVTAEYWSGQHNYHFWNSALPKALTRMGFALSENSLI